MRRSRPHSSQVPPTRVGKRLREARWAKGLTQGALAEQIVKHGGHWSMGSTLQLISMIERGKRVGQKMLLRDAASVLGIPAEWLTSDDEPPVTAASQTTKITGNGSVQCF
jgi:transcriptional regulator with XRE-family HTH domain